MVWFKQLFFFPRMLCPWLKERGKLIQKNKYAKLKKIGPSLFFWGGGRSGGQEKQKIHDCMSEAPTSRRPFKSQVPGFQMENSPFSKISPPQPYPRALPI